MQVDPGSDKAVMLLLFVAEGSGASMASSATGGEDQRCNALWLHTLEISTPHKGMSARSFHFPSLRSSLNSHTRTSPMHQSQAPQINKN